MLHQMARAIKPLLGMAPPDPTSLSVARAVGHGRARASISAASGAKRFHTLHKLLTMSSADFLDEWFETEALKATKSASGIIGTLLGPRSPGTAYVLLHHYMGELDGVFRAWGFAKGGNGSVSAAIAAARAGCGRGDPHATRRSHNVLVSSGRATGVVLEGGEEIRAKHRRLGRRSAPHVPAAGRARSTCRTSSSSRSGASASAAPRRRSTSRSASCRTSPACRGAAPHLRGAISISPSVDYLERAYDDAKYGEISRRPYMDIVIPSMLDPAMAPPGKHVMSIFVQYAPYHLNGGWTDARREALRRRGDRHARAVRAQHEERDPAPPGDHAGRHRAHRRPHRGQHLPGRALAAADVLPAAGAGVGAVPHADRRPLPVRRGHASRRRRDGRFRPQRGARDPGSAHEPHRRHRRRRRRAGRGAAARARRPRSDGDRGRAMPRRPRAGCRARFCARCKLQGLELHWPDPWISAPLPGGGRLELWRDMARSVESIRRVSARDAERWPQFCKRMARLARFLEALYAEPPPDPLSVRLRAARAPARQPGAGGPAAHPADAGRRAARRLVRERRAQGRAGRGRRAAPAAGSALRRHRVPPAAPPRRLPARRVPRAALQRPRAAAQAAARRAAAAPRCSVSP